MATTAYLNPFPTISENLDPNDLNPFVASAGGKLRDDAGNDVQGPGEPWYSGPFAGWSSTFGLSTTRAELLTKMRDEIRLNFQDNTIEAVWLLGG